MAKGMSISTNVSANRKEFCWTCGEEYTMRSAAQKLCQSCRDKGGIVPFKAVRVKLSVLCKSLGIESIES